MNELEREGEEKIEQKPVPPSETGLGATFGWAMVLIFVAVWALLFAWLKKGTASMGVPALHAVLPYGRPAEGAGAGRWHGFAVPSDRLCWARYSGGGRLRAGHGGWNGCLWCVV
jgi:hypothetical protein